MSVFTPETDAYIASSPPFATEILTHLRALVHRACPDATECIKWNFPHFLYQNRILCSMASFKTHCVFLFHRADALPDPANILEKVGKTAMRQVGKIRSLSELPEDDLLLEYLRLAMLNTQGAEK